MKSISLVDIIPERDNVEAYLTFRYIEDWCTEHIPRGRWRFDYSSTICVCGIDIPSRIFFWDEKDVVAFRMQYHVISP